MKLGTSAPAARGSSLEGPKGAGWVKEQRKRGAEQPWEGTGSSLKPPALLQLVLQPELFPARGQQGKKKDNKWSPSTVSPWKGLSSLQGSLWGTAFSPREEMWRAGSARLEKLMFTSYKILFHKSLLSLFYILVPTSFSLEFWLSRKCPDGLMRIPLTKSNVVLKTFTFLKWGLTYNVTMLLVLINKHCLVKGDKQMNLINTRMQFHKNAIVFFKMWFILNAKCSSSNIIHGDGKKIKPTFTISYQAKYLISSGFLITAMWQNSSNQTHQKTTQSRCLYKVFTPYLA